MGNGKNEKRGNETNEEMKNGKMKKTNLGK